MSRKSKIVLITGVAGLIGSNLADALLKKKYHVIGIDNMSIGKKRNFKHNLTNPNFSFWKIDVRELDKINDICRKYNVEIIVHLAAYKIPVRDMVTEDTLLINTKGTETVLEVAEKWGCKVIFASSSDVYGKGAKIPFSENDDLVIGPSTIPRWSYAISKLFDEHLCYAYYDRYNVPIVIIRYFNTYGPRQGLTYVSGGPQALFINAVLKGEPIILYGNGMQRRCFAYIDDTVEGTILAMENEKAIGGIFNIGNDKTEITIRDLALLVGKVSGNEALDIRYVPHETLFKNYEDVDRRVPDLSKARKLLGYDPKIGNEDGLEKTYEWQKAILTMEEQ